MSLRQAVLDMEAEIAALRMAVDEWRCPACKAITGPPPDDNLCPACHCTTPLPRAVVDLAFASEALKKAEERATKAAAEAATWRDRYETLEDRLSRLAAGEWGDWSE